MTTNNTKPAVSIPLAAVPAKRSFNGGVEPGTLRGSRMEIGSREDPDETIRTTTQAMTGPELRLWLKQGNNRELFNSYLARRNK
jgi:hypothetical protein